MNDELKGEQPGVVAQRPRSPRVPVDFAVGLEGRTTEGATFSIQAEAIRVSRGGATLITEAAVELGALVRLTPPFGKSIDAEVNGVWRDESDGKQRIGVKLLDANGWFAE